MPESWIKELLLDISASFCGELFAFSLEPDLFATLVIYLITNESEKENIYECIAEMDLQDFSEKTVPSKNLGLIVAEIIKNIKENERSNSREIVEKLSENRIYNRALRGLHKEFHWLKNN